MFQMRDFGSSHAVGKMNRTDVRLRILAETARAMAAGVTNAAFGRDVVSPVVLRVGDVALQLACPSLSDPGKDVARAYGVLGPSGFASRRTFYVGADGRILDIDTRVHASSHGRDVAARLSELGIS
jgi:hypothetical protein